MNKYFSRLQYFDKVGYDRAFIEFKAKSNNDDDENTFLLSLLESDADFELTTVRNAINFARSWAELGHALSQRVLTRILYLCFLEPKLINQMMFITDIVRDRAWVYCAISKMMMSKYDLFLKSIQEDHQVWNFLIDCLLSDAMSKESECLVNYGDRDHSFLIEAIPLYWPSESTKNIKINDLINAVLEFCVKTQSKTAFSIINIFCFAFPTDVAKFVKNDLHNLSSEALFQLLKLNLITMPTSDPEHGAVIAAKIFPFNPTIALELAESDQNSEDKLDIIEMIKHFNPENQSFSFDS